jgi:hypothetical protein
MLKCMWISSWQPCLVILYLWYKSEIFNMAREKNYNEIFLVGREWFLFDNACIPTRQKMSFKHNIECIFHPKSKTFKYIFLQTFWPLFFNLKLEKEVKKDIKMIVNREKLSILVGQTIVGGSFMSFWPLVYVLKLKIKVKKYLINCYKSSFFYLGSSRDFG